MMKICSKCKVLKNAADFHKGKGKDGLAAWCKSCVANARMKRYYENRVEERQKGNQRNREAAARNRQKVWDYLSTHPCVDCGERDQRVLEFDHVDASTKEHNISTMIGSKHRWEPILDEIAKCEVRCANCHRRKSYKQFGWLTY